MGPTCAGVMLHDDASCLGGPPPSSPGRLIVTPANTARPRATAGRRARPAVRSPRHWTTAGAAPNSSARATQHAASRQRPALRPIAPHCPIGSTSGNSPMPRPTARRRASAANSSTHRPIGLGLDSLSTRERANGARRHDPERHGSGPARPWSAPQPRRSPSSAPTPAYSGRAVASPEIQLAFGRTARG